MVLWVLTSRTSGQSVTQTPSRLAIKEGVAVFINCTYQYSGVAYLYWYVQHSHSEGPQLLLTEYTGKETGDAFFAEHLKADKTFHLRKEAGGLSDSAAYFCAVRDTVEETPDRAA
uniref:Uncharacterized protein n=1 Tax=Sphaerodactylus townsendi TaxID=933632 RepID=A0ACB8EXE2_9SAUR